MKCCTGSFAVKVGLAQMLKGGVIMDVIDAEQARIAEEAGACAVMALERVPADIRRDGGVARMSDPLMIRGDPRGGHDSGDGQGTHRPFRGSTNILQALG
jgi:pyridoxal biosynthesis lyase PdxS